MNFDTMMFFGIASITFALLIVYIYLLKKGSIKSKTDYKALFTLGSALFIVGLAMGNISLLVIGLAFFTSGAVNKKKWKDGCRWSKMTPAEKKFKVVIIVFSSALVVFGLIVYFMDSDGGYSNKKSYLNIKNFDECSKAGYVVMESYPERCSLPSGKHFTRYIGNELEKIDMIRIESPRPNSVIESPLMIMGEAVGTWFFEGDFPVKLMDEKGNVLIESYIGARREWMTEQFIPFDGEISFDPDGAKKGTLILKKDNPSGLPEYEDELIVPVVFIES